MTESAPDRGAESSWTCARCEVTVSFAQGAELPRLPSTWARENGLFYCLSCRREMAGDEGVAGIDDDTPSEKRLQLRSWARIEFEINRDPERPDNQIARACKTSTFAVRKARARLATEPPNRV